jgi:hypothetical protein
MAHFAQVDPVTNTVLQVIVAEQEFVDNFPDGGPGIWIQTSYNTKGGVHYDQEGQPSEDQSKALRYNYASVGGLYDPEADAFYGQKPFESWVLNADAYVWEPPYWYDDGGDGTRSFRWREELHQADPDAQQGWEELSL